jgi:hypothetical protein
MRIPKGRNLRRRPETNVLPQSTGKRQSRVDRHQRSLPLHAASALFCVQAMTTRSSIRVKRTLRCTKQSSVARTRIRVGTGSSVIEDRRRLGDRLPLFLPSGGNTDYTLCPAFLNRQFCLRIALWLCIMEPVPCPTGGVHRRVAGRAALPRGLPPWIRIRQWECMIRIRKKSCAVRNLSS